MMLQEAGKEKTSLQGLHLGAILNFLCGKLLCWLLRRVSVVYFTSSLSFMSFAMLNHHIVLMIVCAINN